MKDHQDDLQHQISITRVTVDQTREVADVVATEEPLEIRIIFGSARRSKSLAVTMRTPGHDQELAAGFLLSEGIIAHGGQLDSFEHVGPAPENGSHGNTLMVGLKPEVEFDAARLQRNFYTTSSCGVCGKASLEAIHAQGMKPIANNFTVPRSVIFSLPGLLRNSQDVFDATGGLHAAGLFAVDGNLLCLREDVGRHNAVDKLIGSRLIALKENFRPTSEILVVSGRASFELVQKAISASIGMMVAVGAPSSLAVELANEFNVTLLGFASEKRFNIYSGKSRCV